MSRRQEYDISRFPSREVNIGDLIIGGNHQIRVQSMLVSDTLETQSAINECIKLIDKGCELIRLTVPSIKEAKHLEIIQTEIKDLGYSTPLVADIHYTPNAALVAADHVDKIRINPGNFVSLKKPEKLEYSQVEQQVEFDKIEQSLIPLIEKCKKKGRAIRIGTNHGSLSNRITSTYGDSPTGMVMSAIEFIEIFRKYNFHNLIVSLKSSNPIIMIEAYRMFVSEMIKRSWDYPLHLGVTEAGEGEDGRIKSAIGIGVLLEDGIGDTIRVSLTENAENEIPVAKSIVARYSDNKIAGSFNVKFATQEFTKRKTNSILNIGFENVPIVIADYYGEEMNERHLSAFGYQYKSNLNKWIKQDFAVDYIFSENAAKFAIPEGLKIILPYKNWTRNEGHFPLIDLNQELPEDEFGFLKMDLDSDFEMERLKNRRNVVFVLYSQVERPFQKLRGFFRLLNENKILNPVILNLKYQLKDWESIVLYSSIDLGGMFIEGFGNGIWIEAPNHALNQKVNLSFGILQASRVRISKTEYISCPSCGRTQFDLQETTAKIQKETKHLKGLKIGIMGCIVNGPGEMADADYGYVGTGKGQISLYKNKQVVKKNIPQDKAVQELIVLLKENGDWVDP